ncbi:NAD(P)H-quinone oxidoreductase [Sphingomonas sp. GB1N7]|uniref:NAD(P)H-quinone oxidoreductase n=1 Tax=Parasphingomonas caseinilytica TaxID=3096158 RepID=UPI002FC664B8
MRAITFKDFGGPEVLEITDESAPQLRPGDLLVRVKAIGVNRADLNQRRGAYGRENFGDSSIMGLEVAGEVIAVASNVTAFAKGDRVMGIVGGGAYAEIARLPAAMAMAIPERISFEDAAAVPEAFVTAHEALFHRGRLAAGEAVLLHGAAGGVGMAAVALAVQAKAIVLFTARDTAIPAVVAVGADRGFDYRNDFLPALLDATGNRGVDLIVDTIGAPNLERNVLALADGGRLVQLGLMGGRGAAPLPMDRLLFRRLEIMGSVMKSRTAAEKAEMTRRFADRWMPALASGAINPIVAKVFPLAAAAEAHVAMEAGGHIGKLVLVP